jgi:hypothetical protein
MNIAEIRQLQSAVRDQLSRVLAENHGAEAGAGGPNALAAFQIIADRLLQGELPLTPQGSAVVLLVDAWVELERAARSLEG